MHAKTALLLVNLGTPAAPTAQAVRPYLRQFLSDPRVIDIHPVLRAILLNVFILPFRPKQSAHAYSQVWLPEGSPLLHHTQMLAQEVQRLAPDIVVEVAMRYGAPCINTVVDDLLARQCERIIVLPLFPQYASATNGSVAEAVFDCFKPRWNIPEIKICGDFFQHPGFIAAYSQVIQQAVGGNIPDYYLFSYHGLPVRHVEKSDGKGIQCDKVAPCPAISAGNRYCYRAQAYATTHALVAQLGLKSQQYGVAFQSRLGRTPWIKPYTDEVLPELYQQGVRHLAVACPSFVADCLETIEEIGMRAKEQWEELGGEAFTMIPCLNAHTRWAEAALEIAGLGRH